MHWQRYDMTIDYEQTKVLYKDIDKELVLLKSLLETQHSNNMTYNPMSVFIDSKHEKMLAITSPKLSTFQENTINIAEMLHLYTALDSFSSIVSLTSKINIDGNDYNNLSIFLVSDQNAYIFILPYRINDDNKIQWLTEHESCVNVADTEPSSEIKDFVTMLFVYTHLPMPVFTIAEILSYLSYNQYGILDFRKKYNYFEMSNN